MEKPPYLLHLFTSTPQASPFDVNMAYDAGYSAVIPYCNVQQADVANLTQDAIFSRGPSGVKRTGIFIGGRDIGLAADMLDAARAAMVPPFVVSVFADPSGAFTTAAAMVAAVERQLRTTHGVTLDGLEVLIFGGTGPVGLAAGVLAAGAGARVSIVSHRGADAARASTDTINTRYQVATEPADGSSPAALAGLLASAHVVLATAKAGVQVLDSAQLEAAASLLVAADVNAVPPAGIEGVGVMDDGVPLKSGSGKAVGIGALAVGNIKYKCQKGLLVSMLQAEKPVFIDFRDAFAMARSLSA
jgi:methylene-tetrahydromethanopterin dehydrogenase